MNWMDLLRMSSSNLKRRKLRTVLTVLGVVIGTASIVVMISLGLGMQQAIYQEIEQMGGTTTITVTGSNSEGMGRGMDQSGEAKADKYVNDALLKDLQKMDHVKSAVPAYEMSAVLLHGGYEGYIQLVAMMPEDLKAMNIPLGQGKLPQSGKQLELLYGNQILTNFYEKGSGKGYWETGKLPDVDLAKDSMFLILDAENYNSDPAQALGGDSQTQDGEKKEVVRAQKHVVRSSGLVEGTMDDYNAFSYYTYCDLTTLKKTLQKEFSGRVIPGQPQTKSGKPYKEFCYTYAKVKVDDMEHVEEVSSEIQSMGYSVQTNAEYMDSMKSQMAIIQAVLGGIGAVSLLVAAIGIANTMMMSIYERTKEIGIIKVLGCSLKNIRQMFLLEAAFIGLIGGVIGNVLSFLMSAAINFIVGQSGSLGIATDISYIPWWMILLSIGFAIFVGVAAGYFPAKRAMTLSPLAAIRNE